VPWTPVFVVLCFMQHWVLGTVALVGAFVLFGLALALGFPARLTQTMLFVCVAAGVLELLQVIDPGRHARLQDAVLKAAAGLIGIAIGRIVFAVARRPARQ